MQRGGGAQMMQHNRAAQLLFHSGHTSCGSSDHPAQYRHLSALHVAGTGAGGGAAINMMPVGMVHAASKASSSQQQQQQLQLALSCAPAADYEEEEEEGVMVTLENTVADNPVVVFSVSSCCLCHVVKKLFCGMGVSPTVVEIDELDCARAAELDRVLVHIMGERPAVPAVFVGGKLIGGLDRLMACHISGALIPQLKAAGALWL